MAVIAIALGAIWVIDEIAVDEMNPSVYPGTALAIIAMALLVSVRWGRSRGLILVGLIATLATTAGTALGTGPIGDRVYRPSSVETLQSEYDHGTGRIVLHLEELRDLENLRGQTIHVDARIGQLQVIVPTSMSVEIAAEVGHGEIAGPSRVDISDLDQGKEATVLSSSGDDPPDLYLDLDLKFGQILITEYNCGMPTAGETRYTLPTDSTEGNNHDAAACA